MTKHDTAEGPPPFTVIPPAQAVVPVVVHVPHSATAIPDDVRAQLLLTDAELQEELPVTAPNSWQAASVRMARPG